MGQFFDTIPTSLIPWIQKQHMFWVATAPLGGEGHVNVSPKGLDGAFHVVDEKTVWYEDISGSGIETIAHLRETGNGRITVMLSAFEGPPRICRLFGTGKVHEFGTPEYDRLLPPNERRPGSRAAIVITVHKVGTSCGYAVPYYEFKSHRTQLLEFYQRREKAEVESATVDAPEKGMRSYWLQKNMSSIDGIPGLLSAPYSDKEFRWSERDLERKIEMVMDKTSSMVDLKLVLAFTVGVVVSRLAWR
ncbi:hypothetical protein BDN72DRAFT_842314 [Pluteus cervinus]|uniref:Uncharacterized protein n=1 Tax=Pluteus cervinus TaxID=181527 RepID=A0ACD3AQ68_9AGAR|nr:hypothetical protein BDN72DRAFT_842314 [Pluteus cervinus]